MPAGNRFIDHSRGFEKEKRLHELHAEVSNLLYQWRDFWEVAKVLNPELCECAFERRPCRRALRYLGCTWADDVPDEDVFFKRGMIYYSIDFNGATYTIEGRGRIIGYAYFEVLQELDCATSD